MAEDTPALLQRIRTLHDSALSAQPDQELDRLAAKVRVALAVPAATLSLIDDEHHQLLHPGLDMLVRAEMHSVDRCTDPDESLCQYVIQSGQPLIVGDISRDAALKDSYAATVLNIRAYMGMPVFIDGDVVIGSLCGFDWVPRTWNTQHSALLRRYAADATRIINARALAHR